MGDYRDSEQAAMARVAQLEEEIRELRANADLAKPQPPARAPSASPSQKAYERRNSKIALLFVICILGTLVLGVGDVTVFFPSDYPEPNASESIDSRRDFHVRALKYASPLSDPKELEKATNDALLTVVEERSHPGDTPPIVLTRQARDLSPGFPGTFASIGSPSSPERAYVQIALRGERVYILTLSPLPKGGLTEEVAREYFTHVRAFADLPTKPPR